MATTRLARRLVPVGALTCLLVMASGCGDTSEDEGQGAGDAAAVTMEASRYSPEEVEVAVGGTVEFTNKDPFAHTVTADDDSPMAFDSDQIGEDKTFSVTFDEAGTYDYFCKIHPTMRASVTVG